ncbi:hypothetical protein C0U44_32235, partial [Klebsiella pneumoniae]
MLQGIWPDVAPGSQLAFVVRGGEGQFCSRNRAAKPGYACCRGSGRTSRRAASWRSWSAAARGSS